MFIHRLGSKKAYSPLPHNFPPQTPSIHVRSWISNNLFSKVCLILVVLYPCLFSLWEEELANLRSRDTSNCGLGDKRKFFLQTRLWAHYSFLLVGLPSLPLVLLMLSTFVFPQVSGQIAVWPGRCGMGQIWEGIKRGPGGPVVPAWEELRLSCKDIEWLAEGGGCFLPLTLLTASGLSWQWALLWQRKRAEQNWVKGVSVAEIVPESSQSHHIARKIDI